MIWNWFCFSLTIEYILVLISSILNHLGLMQELTPWKESYD